jgi:hypothetical protein
MEMFHEESYIMNSEIQDTKSTRSLACLGLHTFSHVSDKALPVLCISLPLRKKLLALIPSHGQRSLKRACMADISDVTTTILPFQDRVVVAIRRNLLSNNFQQY